MKTNSIKYLLWSAFVFLVLIVGWAHYYSWEKADRHIYSLAATIQANIVTVQAQTAGTITALYINNHTAVKRGQLLFQIDPATTINEVTKAQKNLKYVKEEVRKQQQAIIAAERLVNSRQQQISDASKQALLNSQDGNDATIKVPQDDLNQALNQLDIALKQYGKPGYAEEKIAAAQAEVDRAQNKLQMTKIYAPVNGYVNELNTNEGAHVISQQPLIKIVEDNSWWLNAFFKPRDLARIRPQQICSIQIDSVNQPLQGTVEKIGSQDVRIKVLNTESLPIKVGDNALVSILLS